MQTSAERGSNEASNHRPSDRELIARFLASRDESAFAELVTRYSRLVMSVATHTLRDPHAAEDAFQAAFLVLARSARRIRNRDSLASWLHGTTFRVSHRLLRSRLRRKEQDLPNVELQAPIWADPVRPDEQAALDEELARLSEGLRGPLVLHYLEGRTVPEIAAELKMSQSAIEGRLKRGRKTLRKRLLKRGVLLSSAVFGAGSTLPVEAGVTAGLLTATVAACLKSTATTSLTPIAATTIQHLALQETAAMTRIAILKTALLCGGIAGTIGLAGAGANGTLGLAWARQTGNAVVTEDISSPIAPAELPIAPTGVIQTALAQVAGEVPGSPSDNSRPGRILMTRDSGPSVTVVGLSNSTGSGSIQDRVKASLQKNMNVSATGESLGTLLEQWSQELNVPIHLPPGDAMSGFDEHPGLANPVFLVASGVSLEDLLKSLLPRNGLEYQLADDGIHIQEPKPTERGRIKWLLDEERTRFQFSGTPLKDVLEGVERRTNAKIRLDEDAAKRLDLNAAVNATIPLRPIGKALEGVLNELPGGPYSVRAEEDGIHIAAASDASDPPGGSSEVTTGKLGTGPRLNLVGRDTHAKDQQIRALEEEVRGLRAQVEQLRALQTGQKQEGRTTGSSVEASGPTAADAPVDDQTTAPDAVGAPGTQSAVEPTIAMSAAPPRSAEIKALQVQLEQMRAIIEAQKAESRRRGQSDAGPGAAGGSGRPGTSSQTSGEVQKFQSQSTNREQIAQALEHKVDFQFTGQTLQEVMNFLAQHENVVIRLDHTALTNAGVGPDVEINLIISGISLKSALNLMLEDVGGTTLDYVIEDEVMKITTRERADETLQTVIYDVSDLGSVDANWVASTLEKTVEPQSWESAGGKGTIVTNDTAVMVTTSRRLHDKTAEIMQMLEQQAKAKANRFR